MLWQECFMCPYLELWVITLEVWIQNTQVQFQQSNKLVNTIQLASALSHLQDTSSVSCCFGCRGCVCTAHMPIVKRQVKDHTTPLMLAAEAAARHTQLDTNADPLPVVELSCMTLPSWSSHLVTTSQV